MLEESMASPIFKASFALCGFPCHSGSAAFVGSVSCRRVGFCPLPQVHSCETAASCPDSKQDGTGGWQG